MAKKFSLSEDITTGFDDTVNSALNNTGALHVDVIPLRKLELDPDNPREFSLNISDIQNGIATDDLNNVRKIKELQSLEGLSKSISEQGLINPILVYEFGDKYRVVAGERRTLASFIAKKDDIHAKILAARPDPLKLSQLQWVENIEREDLTLWEKLKNLEKIINAYAFSKKINKNEITITELSQILNCVLTHASNYLNILNASDELKLEIQKGNIKNIEKAALIAKAPKSAQNELIRQCVSGATPSELKKISEGSFIQVVKKTKSAPPVKGIRLGTTKEPKVAKIIFDSIIQSEKFLHLKDKVGEVYWDNHLSIKKAFKVLLRLLERSEEV